MWKEDEAQYEEYRAGNTDRARGTTWTCCFKGWKSLIPKISCDSINIDHAIF